MEYFDNLRKENVTNILHTGDQKNYNQFAIKTILNIYYIYIEYGMMKNYPNSSATIKT